MKHLIRFGIAAIAVLGWLYLDWQFDDDDSIAELADRPNLAVSADGSLDTAWFCPTGTRSEDGYAPHTINLSNLSASREATAVVTILTEEGRGASAEVIVAPGQSTSVDAVDIDPPSEDDPSELAGAVVRAIGGKVVVSHSVVTSEGSAHGSCATQAAETWHFATGRVKEGSLNYITLMNPFGEDVSVDIALQIPGGSVPTEIERFQGITLFANSVRQIPIHTAPGFEGREQIPVTVRSRGGRIVAERLQTIDESIFSATEQLQDEIDATEDEDPAVEDSEEEASSNGVQAASLQLGVAGPRTEWLFTSGRVNSESTHFLTIYNPTSFDPDTFEQDTADVIVEIWPTDTSLREAIAVPIEREVTPRGIAVVDLVSEMRRLGFLLPTDFTARVQSRNGVELLAERWQFGEKVSDSFEISLDDLITEAEPEVGDAGDLFPPADFDPNSPDSASVGLMTSAGVDFDPARSWMVPWTPTPTPTSSWITVFAPSANTDVSVFTNDGEELAPAGDRENLGNPGVLTEAGARWFFPLTDDGSGGAALLVQASKPVYVESQVVSAEVNSTLPAVPLAE